MNITGGDRVFHASSGVSLICANKGAAVSKLNRMLIWSLISVVTLTSAAIAIEKARSANGGNRSESLSSAAPLNQQAPAISGRNLSLQPEAFKLRKRLGQRFTDTKRSVSVFSGVLTVGSKAQTVQMTRRQKLRGERIEIALATDSAVLTWDEEEGAKTRNRAPNEADRNLIERLALDSAEQFVLAQLRGAGYYTVGRNVRPAEAGDSDSYSGPLWTIVRVTETAGDRQKEESKPRLYFINESTGLIDKVVSESGGEKVEATFSGWTSQNGETFPTRIVWTRNGQKIMEFSVTNLSRLSA